MLIKVQIGYQKISNFDIPTCILLSQVLLYAQVQDGPQIKDPLIFNWENTVFFIQ